MVNFSWLDGPVTEIEALSCMAVLLPSDALTK